MSRSYLLITSNSERKFQKNIFFKIIVFHHTLKPTLILKLFEILFESIEAATWRSSVKKAVLKSLAKITENICDGVLFFSQVWVNGCIIERLFFFMYLKAKLNNLSFH